MNEYVGEFKPDASMGKLCDMLQDYYTKTDKMDNKSAMDEWRKFRASCRSMGFTSSEVNKAKTAREYIFSDDEIGRR